MELHPYTANKAPTETLALRPKLLTWTSRVWRESPVRTMPLFKIEGRLEPREVEDNALSQALRPYAPQLQKLTIYLLHPEETPRLAPWAVGRFDLDAKSAYMFFHDFRRFQRRAAAFPDADCERCDRHRDQRHVDARRGAQPSLRGGELRLRHPQPHRLTRPRPSARGEGKKT